MNIDKLNLVIQLLQSADVLQQEAGVESEMCYEFHNKIQNLIDEFQTVVEESYEVT